MSRAGQILNELGLGTAVVLGGAAALGARAFQQYSKRTGAGYYYRRKEMEQERANAPEWRQKDLNKMHSLELSARRSAAHSGIPWDRVR